MLKTLESPALSRVFDICGGTGQKWLYSPLMFISRRIYDETKKRYAKAAVIPLMTAYTDNFD